MAGDWIKMSYTLPHHPKVLQMAKSLCSNEGFISHAYVTGHDRDMTVTGVNEVVCKSAVIAGLLQVWGSVRKHGTIDGFDMTVYPLSICDLDSISGFPGFGVAMESVGWAIQEANLLIRFPKCLENMTSPEEREREKARLRKQQQRERQKELDDCDTNRDMSRQCHANVTPRVEKSREDKTYIKEKEKNKAKKEKEKLELEKPKPDETTANGLVPEKQEIKKNRKPRVSSKIVEQIFNDWKTVTGNTGARLGKKRPEIIRESVRMGYTIEQHHQAFIGCTRSSFHMGFNSQGKKYDDIELILRSEKNIDRFIGYASNPPQPTWKSSDTTPYETRRQAMQFFQSACQQAEMHVDVTGTGTTIDSESWEIIQPGLLAH